jgi:hypothetical protein
MSYLLSSVDPVLYCDTNGPTHAPTLSSLVPSTDSVFTLFTWVIVDSALHCPASQRGESAVCAVLTAAALLFASFWLDVMIYLHFDL